MTPVVSAEKQSVAKAAPQGVVNFIEMSDVFSAAATDVLALDATDMFSADTTDIMAAGRGRPKAERRRPKADLLRVDALGAFRRPGHRPAGGRRRT